MTNEFLLFLAPTHLCCGTRIYSSADEVCCGNSVVAPSEAGCLEQSNR